MQLEIGWTIDYLIYFYSDIFKDNVYNKLYVLDVKNINLQKSNKI